MFLILHWRNNTVICKKKKNQHTTGTLPLPLSFGKIWISIIEKKNWNENCGEFDFRMGTVLGIFSFFWTDNVLVYVPPPP